MNRPAAKPTTFSKVSVKSQTVLPREVRAKLGIKPGDTLRYRLTDEGVLIDKAPGEIGRPVCHIFRMVERGGRKGLCQALSRARYAAFDIVVVPFPYADRLAEKRRPALVISSAKLAATGLLGGDDRPNPWPSLGSERRLRISGTRRPLLRLQDRL